jgi:hypothetical protein
MGTIQTHKLRNMLWPRMGLRRYGTYLRKRVMRLSASPHAIAAGVASGAAVSMFPLIGLHFFLGFVLAYVTRGNMLAAAFGTAWGIRLPFHSFLLQPMRQETGSPGAAKSLQQKAWLLQPLANSSAAASLLPASRQFCRPLQP